MTNESGTAQQQRKRVRIADEAVTVLGNKQPSNNTPSDAARRLVKKGVASHTESIQTYITSVSRDYNALKSKQRQQETSIAKLQEPSFIPRSARVQFALTAPDRVKEHDEFKKHKTNVEKALATFQAECKKAILGTALLQNEQTKDDARKLMIKTIINLCHLLLLKHNPTNKNPEYHLLAYYLVDTGLDQTIHDHTWTTQQRVLTAIKSEEIVSDQMELDDAAAPATQEGAIEHLWAVSDNKRVLFDTITPSVNELLLLTFVSSWNAQIAAYQKKEVETALAVATKRIMATEATDQAAQEVDKEPPIGPKKIKELIDNAVKQKTKNMQSELNKLSEKLQRSAKNETRGAAPSPAASGAPSTKNNDAKKSARQGAKNGNNNNKRKPNKTEQTKGKPRSHEPSADATLSGKSNPKRGRGSNKPPPKRTHSKTRNNRN
ncbi:hypothetical protein ACA910_004516 [Epithemia clementina (nom. ined.)]